MSTRENLTWRQRMEIVPGRHRPKRVRNGAIFVAGVKLHQDASLSLRWRTLLGRNMYVDLDPGSPSAPALPGNFIPRSRTSDQVELDTALEPLDAGGRRAFQTMINEFDRGFADPEAFAGTLDAAAPALRNAARGLEPLTGTQPNDLRDLVGSTSRALGALARDEQALSGVLDHGQVALGATAARRADLADTVNTVPGALRDTRTTMN